MSKSENIRNIFKGLQLEQELICVRVRKIVTQLVDERNSLLAIQNKNEQSIVDLSLEINSLKSKIDFMESVDSPKFEGIYLN